MTFVDRSQLPHYAYSSFELPVFDKTGQISKAIIDSQMKCDVNYFTLTLFSRRSKQLLNLPLLNDSRYPFINLHL